MEELEAFCRKLASSARRLRSENINVSDFRRDNNPVCVRIVCVVRIFDLYHLYQLPGRTEDKDKGHRQNIKVRKTKDEAAQTKMKKKTKTKTNKDKARIQGKTCHKDKAGKQP